jgi:hypothetical protein
VEVLIKYKNHLIILAAILTAKFVLIPMFDNQQALHQVTKLSEKRISKIEKLIDKKERLIQAQGKLQLDLAKINTLLFTNNSESNFKISAQGIIETALKDSNCTIEQVGWDGMQTVAESLNRWQLKAQYKGDANCLLKATRNLEELEPLVRIKSFFYGGKQIEKKPNSIVTARLELIMWQYTGDMN